VVLVYILLTYAVVAISGIGLHFTHLRCRSNQWY
jgi:hypothetical protein